MKRIALLVLGLGLATVPAVTAAPITFEGQANTIYGTPITRLGFDIGNTVGQEQHFHEIDSTGFGLPSNGTGVLLNDRDTEIFVVATGGGTTPFSLASVDVGSALNNNPAVGLEIRGYLNNVLVGTIVLASLGQGYTTLLGGSLGAIDRLIFDGQGGLGGFVLDNLDLGAAVTPVPEPASLLLIGTGLALVARRRLRTRQ